MNELEATGFNNQEAWEIVRKRYLYAPKGGKKPTSDSPPMTSFSTLMTVPRTVEIPHLPRKLSTSDLGDCPLKSPSIEQTQGNPSLLEESVRTLIDTGAFKLPSNCRFAVRSDLPSFDNLEEMDRIRCCRELGLLAVDESLCKLRQTADEGYRFIWDSSFNGRGVVQISRTGDAVTLLWKYRWLRSPQASNSPVAVKLSLREWEKVTSKLEALSFWSLEPTIDNMGLDGADWLIDGHRGELCHAVRRWSPNGVIYDLGRLLFDLSGPPLAGVGLY